MSFASAHLTRIIGTVIALAWGGFWTWFGLACAISEKGRIGEIAAHAMRPGGIFLLSALVALRYEAIGMWLLLLEGITITILYPMTAGQNMKLGPLVTVMAMLAGPPLVAAALFGAHLFGGKRG